ncbi:hypothetical protein AMTRI_Chr06g200880 [Amborella trichopoda]
MFYSQFILAKKGPLGTIWIAAHLERKLRKNQVADTDIGVSVDSILFPEVPIALRLSSHLLLGVVRIYSRKVNYLFHDCSEALLKIKQAFRSTAVDLPPEESTAPYHSITLPETFDLDDFELPENAFSHGGFVDHHVSTRDQITLQDNMDDTMYPTSQFGLDERFGDGDATQIVLDFDEDPFVDKVQSPGQSNLLLGSEEDAQKMASSCHMDIDEPPSQFFTGEGSHETAKDMDEDDFPCSPTLELSSSLKGESFCRPDAQGPPATPSREAFPNAMLQAPCTPSLSEEAIPASVQEVPEVSKSMPDSSPSPPLHGDLESKVDNYEGPHVKPNESNEEASQEVVCEVYPPTSIPDCTIAKDERALQLETENPVTLLGSAFHLEGKKSLLETESNKTVTSPLPHVVPTEAATLSPDSLVEVSRSPADNPNASIEENATTSDLKLENATVNENQVPQTSEIHENGEAVENQHNPRDAQKSYPGSEIVSGGGAEVGETELQNHDSAQDLQSLKHDVHDKSECFGCDTLRPCNSVGNGVELVGPDENGAILSPRDMSNASEKDDTLDGCSASTIAEVQGETCHNSQTLDPGFAVEPSSQCVPSQTPLVFGSSEDLTPLDSEEPNDMGSKSSENFQTPAITPPETLRLAPTEDERDDELLKNFISKRKSIAEEGRSVEETENVYTRKRQKIDSIPALQEGISGKSSKVSLFKPNMDYIPDDDDLLSSILGGRRTPVFKLKPTPPEPVPSRKRPRSTPKENVNKRKVLLDDSMVLHGDVIRQQLSSTEDIRRVRKKAPCTPYEIWVINKDLRAHEIFEEPIITGLCAELVDLYSQASCMIGTGVSHISGNDCNSEALKFGEFYGDRELREGNAEGADELPESMPDQPLIEVENHHNENAISECGGHAQESAEFLAGISSSMVKNGESVENGSVELTIQGEVPQPSGYDAISIDGEPGKVPSLEPSCNGLASSSNEASTMDDGEAIRHQENGGSPCLQDQRGVELQEVNGEVGVCTDNFVNKKDVANEGIVVLTETFVVEQGTSNEENTVVCEEVAGGRDESNGETGIFSEKLADERDGKVDTACGDMVPDTFNNDAPESGSGIVKDSSDSLENMDSSKLDTTIGKGGEPEPTVIEGQELVGITRSDSEIVVEDRERAEKPQKYEQVQNSDEIPSGEHISSEYIISGSPWHDAQFDVEMRDEPKVDCRENPTQQEGSSGADLSETATDVHMTAVEDPDDFDHVIDGSNTEFLFEDDDALPEDGNNDMPNAEQERFLENAGWSSRTRAVARYLQILFDDRGSHSNKAGRGAPQKVGLDRLLVGKSRKEASRMFFETLVLKTRDYLDVEQEKSFNEIHIRPRPNLMKAEF